MILIHGLAEHLGPYDELARRLAAENLLAFGHDHGNRLLLSSLREHPHCCPLGRYSFVSERSVFYVNRARTEGRRVDLSVNDRAPSITVYLSPVCGVAIFEFW